MKNYKCMLEWNSHCNPEDIEDMNKRLKQFVKTSFWNTTKMELNYKEEKINESK